METDLAALAARLQRLEDLEAVRADWLDYCNRVDLGDFAALGDVFTEDAELEMDGLARSLDGTYRSRRSIVDDFYARTADPSTRHTVMTGHIATNMQIELDGDTATTLAYFFEIVDDNLRADRHVPAPAAPRSGPVALRVPAHLRALPARIEAGRSPARHWPRSSPSPCDPCSSAERPGLVRVGVGWESGRMGERLAGRVAVVVGGGQTPGETIGNGRATSILFAREGARVLVVDRDLESANATVAMIHDEGGQAAGHAADITDEASCATIPTAALERYGALDILHNNVGIGTGDLPGHQGRRGGVAAHLRREPHRHVAHVQGGDPGDARARRRVDREHLVDRVDLLDGDGGVPDLQGGRELADRSTSPWATPATASG